MTEPRIRILIIDDHAVVRKGLAMVLRQESGFEVVAEAGDGRHGLEMAVSLKPDLVLLDLVMPVMDGVATTAALRTQFAQMRILILSGAGYEEKLPGAIAAGADGYISKDVEPEELEHAIRVVSRGETFLHPSVARLVMERYSERRQVVPKVRLTKRELEILGWMTAPASYGEIAAQLNISEETVRSHAKRVLRKLGQPNRVQAVLAGVRIGLINLPDEQDIRR